MSFWEVIVQNQQGTMMKARAVLLLCCSVGIIGNEGDSFLESCDTILYFVSFNLFLSSYSLKGLSIFNNN